MKTWWVPLLALGWLAVSSCTKKHDDLVVSPRDPARGAPASPEILELEAQVGSREAVLSWSLRDSSGVGHVVGYTVWLRLERDVEFEQVDSVAAPPARITGLVNGETYEVVVRPVLDTGLQGEPSRRIRLTPGLYSIVLEGGRDVTASLQVRVGLEAPEGTQGVRLGTSEDLSGEPILPFRQETVWELEPVDGPQRVYAQFLNAEGHPSEPVWDEIVLDRRAEIREVVVEPEAAAHEPGDTLHFLVDAGEAGGTAWVVLGQDGRRKDLLDDGTQGDGAAADGVYGLYYVVESDLRMKDGAVTAHFQDLAGNVADPVIAPVRLTVDPGPTPVTLLEPSSPNPTSLHLQWTQALDGEAFASYRVLRALGPGVTERSDREVRATFTDRSRTEYTDAGLEPGRTYYYVVEVVDAFGVSSASNEISAQTQANEPPEAVVLEEPISVSEERVVLQWSRSTATDFSAYRIIRGTTPDPLEDPQRRILDEIRDADETLFEDRQELEEGQTYYYVVEVVDDLGAATASNAVSAQIPNLPPSPVTLQTPSTVGETSVLLGWSASGDLDFSAYRLYRDTAAGVGESAELVAELSQQETTQWLDTGLVENTTYYYRVFVVDKGGLTAGSNEIEVVTANAAPQAITLASVQEDTEAFTPTVRVTWTASQAHDFQSYRIYRDVSGGVTTSATLVREILDAEILQATDADLQDNTTYYYRVFVFDDRGESAGSNELSVTTANRAPEPVTLSVSQAGGGSIALAWTESQAHDFQAYELYRSTDPDNFTNLVGTWTFRTQTGHTVAVAEGDSTLYFFRLTVRDKGRGGNADASSVSNVVSARGWGP
jgi:fibronectin type 3 domain-containing protein